MYLLAIEHDKPDRYESIQFLSGFDFGNVTWSCKLKNDSQICNGFSECQTDECHNNQSDVFYCADGSGFIDWDKLCNSIADLPILRHLSNIDRDVSQSRQHLRI